MSLWKMNGDEWVPVSDALAHKILVTLMQMGIPPSTIFDKYIGKWNYYWHVRVR
jgi:hypothetical protein